MSRAVMRCRAHARAPTRGGTTHCSDRNRRPPAPQREDRRATSALGPRRPRHHDDVAEREDGRRAPSRCRTRAKASRPRTKTMRRVGRRPRRAARAACRSSTTGPARSSSIAPGAEARACPRSRARPCAGGARAGAIAVGVLVRRHAPPARSAPRRAPSASRTSSAARRCARWIGSKVPPKRPMPPRRASARGSDRCRAPGTCRS